MLNAWCMLTWMGSELYVVSGCNMKLLLSMADMVSLECRNGGGMAGSVWYVTKFCCC